MNVNMSSFVKCFVMGWVSKGAIKADEAASYYFGDSTLVIYSDDGSLSHSWDWATMQYDVEVNK